MNLHLKGNVPLLTGIFQQFIRQSIKDFSINILDTASFPGFTMQCGLKYIYFYEFKNTSR